MVCNSLSECAQLFSQQCSKELQKNSLSNLGLLPVVDMQDVYRSDLFDEKGAPLDISVIGCSGTNAPEKRQIAENLQRMPSSFLIHLGDGFYPVGPSTATDKKFAEYFENYYSVGNLTENPVFNVLGNHDLNFQHTMAKLKLLFDPVTTPYDYMMAQILHTYLPAAERKNWCMPNQYYVLQLENVNIFFLNSNLLVFDQMQQAWLEKTYRQLNPPGSKKWNIVAMHHPLHSPGKRNIFKENVNDIDQYALPEFSQQIIELKSKGNYSINFALYLYFSELKKQSIFFEIFLGAHDHLLAAMWQRSSLSESWQIISAGAGAKSELQDIEIAAKDIIKNDNFLCHQIGKDFFAKQNGHVQLKVLDQTKLFVTFYNLLSKPIHQKLFKKDPSGVSCLDQF